MAQTATTVWRDYETEYVPASGPHAPAKREIREWGSYVETMLAGVQAGGGLIFESLAVANQNLNYPSFQVAWIAFGPEAGVYVKSGATGLGTWVKQLDLPYNFFRAINSGAGSANAIVAAYNGFPTAKDGALVVVNATASNTSTTVTLKLGNDVVRTIKTASGGNPPVGGIVAGMLLTGVVDGANFRLISDLATAAYQIGAEAAAQQAAASVASAQAQVALAVAAADSASTQGAGDVPMIGSRAAAQLMSFPAARSYVLVNGYAAIGDCPQSIYTRVATQPAHAGKFRSADRYLPNGTTDNANGGWWELTIKSQDYVSPLVFGVKTDGTDNWLEMQDCIYYAVTKGLQIFWIGTITVGLSQTIQMIGGTWWCALIGVSGTKLLGVQGLTWLKLADNSSTDGAVKPFNLIGINTACDGFVSDGVSYDLNGQNNKISPNRDKTNVTVTISIASPGVVTWTGHGLTANTPLKLATTGALPTGLTAGTEYYVKTVLGANTFTLSSTVGGAAINTSGSQSGSHKASLSNPYNPYNCAAVMVSGSVASGGVDARLMNARFANGTIKNSPGVTALGLGQAPYGFGATTKGYDTEIYNMKFDNNGLDVRDHSSIYSSTNSVHIHHCMFTFPFFSTGVRGPVVAVECHGARIKCTHNRIENYCQGFWVSGGEDGTHDAIIISDNSMKVSYIGIGLYDDPVVNDGISDFNFTNNQIHITADPIVNTTIAADARCAIRLLVRASYGIRGVVALNNLVCDDRTGNFGIFVAADGSPVEVGAITVGLNRVSGFSRGIYVQTSNGGSMSSVDVLSNSIDNVANVTPAITTFGIGSQTGSGRLALKDNAVRAGSGGALANVGISLSGALDELSMDMNDADGTTDIIDSVTAGRRRGRQARSFSGVPAQSGWFVGDETFNRQPTLLGSSPNKYVVMGWRRITTGTGNVLGTDWVEQRASTGT